MNIMHHEANNDIRMILDGGRDQLDVVYRLPTAQATMPPYKLIPANGKYNRRSEWNEERARVTFFHQNVREQST